MTPNDDFDTYGQTALLMASQENKVEVVRELCARGADVNAASTFKDGSRGNSALMGAVANNHLEIARELCARGADVNAVTMDDGLTVLMVACIKGHLNSVRLLLQQGANKAAKTRRGATAFTFASGPHKAALKALLEL